MIRLSRIARACFVLLSTLTLRGQSFSGTIVGRVTDSSAAVVQGASVTILNEGTGAQRHVNTDSGGIYTAAELAVGYYTIRYEASGLGATEQQRVKVDVGSET